jgi:hypothetical protein
MCSSQIVKMRLAVPFRVHMKESKRNSNFQHRAELRLCFYGKGLRGEREGRTQTTQIEEDHSLTACQNAGRTCREG